MSEAKKADRSPGTDYVILEHVGPVTLDRIDAPRGGRIIPSAWVEVGTRRAVNQRTAIIELLGEDAEGIFRAIPASSAQPHHRMVTKRLVWSESPALEGATHPVQSPAVAEQGTDGKEGIDRGSPGPGSADLYADVSKRASQISESDIGQRHADQYADAAKPLSYGDWASELPLAEKAPEAEREVRADASRQDFADEGELGCPGCGVGVLDEISKEGTSKLMCRACEWIGEPSEAITVQA